MDIQAYLQDGIHGPVMTRLYDKRTEPAFLARLQPIRLQHMGTCLSANCKWNIFDAQFVRFTRIISDKDNFVAELLRLLHDLMDRGYPRQELLRRCRRRIVTSHILFGVARGVAHTSTPQQHAHAARGLYPLIERLL